MTRDANLLFALLALQMNFISREHLVACLPEIYEGRAADLGRLLVERGHLQEAERLAVMAVHEARLKRHGGDTGASIAEAAGDRTVHEALEGAELPAAVVKTLGGGGRVPKSAKPLAPETDRYEVGREIARGGLGRVVEATDRRLGREVAIKLMLDGLPAALAERFEREARLTARLDHPQVVPVHDFGDVVIGGERQRFLAMKRVRGRDLREILKDVARGRAAGTWTRARLLGVFQSVCLGVAYAHSKGVIHRDLKPANVMVGDFGEVYVVDWGLAKQVGERAEAPAAQATAGDDEPIVGEIASSIAPQSASLTVAGEVIGTPAYMAPEQAAGRVDDVDERTDVYALGAILYEILALRPPVEGESVRAVLDRAAAGRISPISGASPGSPPAAFAPEPVPPELEAACMRALAFRPEDRFASPLDLHRDVQRFLDGELDRDRRRREAAEGVAAGRRLLDRYRALAGEIATAAEEARHAFDVTDSWAPVEAKAPLWAAHDRAARLREDRIRAFADASAAFGRALVADPKCAAASDGLCDLSTLKIIEAERSGNAAEALLHRSVVALHDPSGRHRDRLEAPGRLALRVETRDCGCLAATPGKWRVTFGGLPSVAWRDGRPVPGLAVTEDDRPVPPTAFEPATARWGHGPGCAKRRVKDAEIWISRHVERGRRLLAGSPRRLGAAPLDVELAQGSWRVEVRAEGFATAVVPVRITRAGRWEQEVCLYRESEIPPGFLLVPGGPWTEVEASPDFEREETPRVTQDLFVARVPVTVREYFEFLDGLAASGKEDEAQSRRIRDRDRTFVREEGGRFALAPPEPGAVLTGLDQPVTGISWHDALAYCTWRSSRDGRLVRLLHEEEYQKAACGVDGRTYPWGEYYDGTFGNCNKSSRTPLLAPVGSFEADESPYGIRDMAGGVLTWSWNAGFGEGRPFRARRGGHFRTSPEDCRPGQAVVLEPRATSLHLGFRLAVAPFTG